jgi:STE24 endopeptidase
MIASKAGRLPWTSVRIAICIPRICSVRPRLSLPVALISALIAAEAAVVLLRPREPLPRPEPVEARAYFSAAQIEKAETFRAGQRRLFLLRVAIEGGLLIAVVRRGPEIKRLAGRPVLAGAAAGAALSLALTAVTLPVSAIARERAKDVGLVTQSWTGWAGDVAKGEAIGIVIAAAGGALLVFGMRRFGRRWWIPGTAVVLGFGALTTFAGPVVLDPLFNKFTPVPPGKVRSAVLDLAARENVDVGEVYEVDASRRTTAANAYVNGLGRTKRVVLYDNLVDDFEFEELRLVVAHELSHVANHDVPHGLLFLALVAPFGMFAVARTAEALGAKPGARAVPAVALSLALVVPGVTAVSNQLSRRIESRADAEAMQATGNAQAQIDFQRRIAIKNVSDPDPPRWAQLLLGTHPTTLERIGAAERLKK